MHVFSNNAVGTLREPIPFSESFSTLMMSVEEGALFAALPSASSEGGPKQALTLTDPSEPDVYEIVYAVSRTDFPTSVNILVERGQEGTTPRSWGTNTKVSARVTAGMLDSFTQKSPDGKVEIGEGARVLGETGVAINAISALPGEVAIAGYTSVFARIPEPRNALKNVPAYESVVCTHGLHLASAGLMSWTPSYMVYDSNAWGPSTPDGNQYVPTFDGYPEVRQVRAGSVEPAWNTTAAHTEFTEASEPGVSGRWTRFNLTEGVVLDFGGRLLLPTEVGFISIYYVPGTTPPSVTVEDADDGTPLVTNQPLAGLPLGENIVGWCRFTSVPNKGFGKLRFKVDSPGDASVLLGAFYAKGVFV